MDFYLIFSSILRWFPYGKWVFVFKGSPLELEGGAGTVAEALTIVIVAKSVPVLFFVSVYRVG